MEPHVGKPVRVSGEVESVDRGLSGVIPQVHLRSGAALLLLFFEGHDAESQTLALNIGDRIVASGDIYGILTNLVSLANCKLIDVRGRVV
jgi:hypothetical protein